MMRTFLKISLMFMLLGIVIQPATAQVDPHFSQYYMHPHYLNPATTGIMGGDQRVAAVFRNQWADITNAFSTKGLTADLTTNKNMNFGINILSQTAGDAGYTYNNAYFSLAYTGLKFGPDESKHIVIGMQAGFISRKVEPSKFKWGDQWNPVTGFNPLNPTTDIFTTTSSMVPDFAAGVLYIDNTVERLVHPYLGFAAFHINKPKDPFMTGSVDDKYIPMRFSVHGGVSLIMGDNLTLVSNWLYMKQGTSTDKVIGTYLQTRANDVTDVMLGMNYRLKDAVIPFAGVTFNNLTFGVSYDINVSTMAKTGVSANSFEFTLSYIRKNPARENYFLCPKM